MNRKTQGSSLVFNLNANSITVRGYIATHLLAGMLTNGFVPDCGQAAGDKPDAYNYPKLAVRLADLLIAELNRDE